MKLSLFDWILLSALSLLWGIPAVTIGVLSSKEIYDILTEQYHTYYSLIPDYVCFLIGAIFILAALVILWRTRKHLAKIVISSCFVMLSLVSVPVFAMAVSYGNLPYHNPMPLFSYCMPILFLITSIIALIYFIFQKKSHLAN